MTKEKMVELVVSAQNGDSTAMNQLFEGYYNELHNYACKTVKDPELAYDMVQEAFIDIFNHLQDLSEPVAFASWAKTITHRRCVKYFEKKKDVLVTENEEGATIFDTLEEEHTEFIPGEGLEIDEFKSTIMGIIDELPGEQRAATILYFYDEIPVKEIAKIQEVSEGTVKSRLYYARSTMKKAVEEYEKKHNIKLHSFGFLPFIKWLYKGVFEAETDSAAKAKVAEGVSKAIGKTITVSGATSAATASGVAATGVVAKFMALPIATKIIAGIAAATLTIGGVAGVSAVVSPESGTPKDSESEVWFKPFAGEEVLYQSDEVTVVLKDMEYNKDNFYTDVYTFEVTNNTDDTIALGSYAYIVGCEYFDMNATDASVEAHTTKTVTLTGYNSSMAMDAHRHRGCLSLNLYVVKGNYVLTYYDGSEIIAKDITYNLTQDGHEHSMPIYMREPIFENDEMIVYVYPTEVWDPDDEEKVRWPTVMLGVYNKTPNPLRLRAEDIKVEGNFSSSLIYDRVGNLFDLDVPPLTYRTSSLFWDENIAEDIRKISKMTFPLEVYYGKLDDPLDEAHKAKSYGTVVEWDANN